MQIGNNSKDIESKLYKVRHSLAHILAQAVLRLRPGSTLGFGPPITDGFYYDFVLTSPISESDFPDIEKEMRKIIHAGAEFVYEELDKDSAFDRIDDMGEPYKREYALELCEKNNLDSLSFYRSGDFLDMCEGPHVEKASDIPSDAFKLRSVAGAYWRGNSDFQMMTRVYAWAFLSKKELKEHIKNYELAIQRDHKKLGKELDLFVIDQKIGKGLPLWLPNGTVIRDELEKLAKEMEFRHGYERVTTPHLAKESLYYETGHLPYYAAGMYPSMEIIDDREVAKGDNLDGQEEAKKSPNIKESYRLRPMNCPHHHRIFSAIPRSYRDLPVRMAEYGQVYRLEDSGAIGGLVRVRGMCMNDAHIYCTPEQIKSEFKAVISMYQEAYAILGLENYFIRFSRWDPDDPKGKEKYVDAPEQWEASEAILKEVLDELELDYVEGKGEAAFYGPKLDIQFLTVTGREESVSTVQLDFSVPEKLGLKYQGADGQMHTPYCIHRAPFSTHERFVAFLIEHFGAAFPTWLAPIQVQVLTVSDQFNPYAQEVVNALRDNFVRAELASGSETLGKKIREGTVKKIPNLLIIGEKESEGKLVTLRCYGVKQQVTVPFKRFKDSLIEHIRLRALTSLQIKE